MNKLKKLILVVFISSFFNQNISAELPYYLDFKFILNESTAGKKAQIDLKKKLENGLKELRQKVINLQKNKKNLLDTVAKQRSKARSELLKNLNPVIKDYMQEKKIRYVMDKKSLILADESLDITQDIIKKLNDKIKSIKLN